MGPFLFPRPHVTSRTSRVAATIPGPGLRADPSWSRPGQSPGQHAQPRPTGQLAAFCIMAVCPLPESRSLGPSSPKRQLIVRRKSDLRDTGAVVVNLLRPPRTFMHTDPRTNTSCTPTDTFGTLQRHPPPESTLQPQKEPVCSEDKLQHVQREITKQRKPKLYLQLAINK